jgi:hypothetical protein
MLLFLLLIFTFPLLAQTPAAINFDTLQGPSGAYIRWSTSHLYLGPFDVGLYRVEEGKLGVFDGNRPGRFRSLTLQGVQLNPTDTLPPSCDSANRGTIWASRGDTAVADVLRICTKGSDDTFNWAVVGESSGGGEEATGVYTATFEAATTWTIPGATHALGTCFIGAFTYSESAGIYTSIRSDGWTCNTNAGANQYDVTVNWEVAQAGSLLLISTGGSGGGGSGEATVVSNSGAGAQVLKASTNVTARTLVGGTGVSISQNIDTITIDAASGGAITVGVGLLGVGTALDPIRADPAVLLTFLNHSETVNSWGTVTAACTTKTMTVPGVLSGDAVAPRWPADLPAKLIGIMRVSAADTVTITLCNPDNTGVAVADGFQFGVKILKDL